MSCLVRTGTPLELYSLGGREVWVKREDLCVDEANFSKLRGVYSHLLTRREKWIGVLDSYHSKAGWGCSHIGGAMGKRVVVFYPQYKSELYLREPQMNAKRLGATLKGIPAGRSCILYHTAKKLLAHNFSDSYMMPNALKLVESVDETASEVSSIPDEFMRDTTWVVSVSSGTIGAGVLLGLVRRMAEVNLIIHMGYSRPETAIKKYLLSKVGEFGKIKLTFVDEGYGYKDAVDSPCPFPCNKYYDLKAWKWLGKNAPRIDGKILFWNIGA